MGFLPLSQHVMLGMRMVVPAYRDVLALPSLLGVHGCLERARCACDPATQTFYCGPASRVGYASEAHQWMQAMRHHPGT